MSISMNINKGAELCTIANISVEGEHFATLRSLHGVTITEMSDFLRDIFSGQTTTLGSFGTREEPALGEGRYIELDNDVVITTDYQWLDGIMSFQLMSEWEETIKRAQKLAAMKEV